MRKFKLIVLTFYLFICAFMIILALFHLVKTVLDPSLTYLGEAPLAGENGLTWHFKYFLPNVATIAAALGLLSIAYLYVSKGMTGAWSWLYNIGLLCVLAISMIIVYMLSSGIGDNQV